MLLFIGLGEQEMLLILVLLSFIPVLPLWTIFKKSGQNPWISLIAFVPGVGVIITLYIAAYSIWRIEK